MTVTRTRISGNYFRPTSSCSNGRTTRTRVSGSYVKPACGSFFSRGVTRTPVYSHSTWFSNPFRSFWYSPPVYTAPVYTPTYMAAPIVPPPAVVREPTPVTDAILATALIVGLVALVAVAASQQSICHLDRVCDNFGLGPCVIEEVCTPIW